MWNHLAHRATDAYRAWNAFYGFVEQPWCSPISLSGSV
jgi:hypothetical protein